jgi:hypothetical protein
MTKLTDRRGYRSPRDLDRRTGAAYGQITAARVPAARGSRPVWLYRSARRVRLGTLPVQPLNSERTSSRCIRIQIQSKPAQTSNGKTRLTASVMRKSSR